MRLITSRSRLVPAHRLKALIFTLIRAFEFELAVRPEQIRKKSSIVQRPVVTLGGDKKDDKVEMPLIIRPYRHA